MSGALEKICFVNCGEVLKYEEECENTFFELIDESA